MDELVDAVLTHAVDDPDAANWEDDEQ
jgi:hypothetical protein